MDIEQFYIEKQHNFVFFISELRAKLSLRPRLKEPKSPCGLSLKNPCFYNTHCISPDLDFASLQGYKILLKAAIASGTVDSYVKKFLLEDEIDVKCLPADRLAKIKRYLEMFSEL